MASPGFTHVTWAGEKELGAVGGGSVGPVFLGFTISIIIVIIQHPPRGVYWLFFKY